MIVAIVQARMGSSRLPEKVFKKINGRPMLGHVLQRLQKSQHLDKIIVATTIEEEDNIIASFCEEYRIAYYRGSEKDVLDRYYKAAREAESNAIVRITADCPLLDPQVVDRVVGKYLEDECDYASNAIERTYPDGLDVEVFSFNVLETAWKKANLPSEREHVTPYIWKNDENFDISHVKLDRNLSQFRWTVDELEDLIFVREVYSHLDDGDYNFESVLDIVEEHDELTSINSHFEINEGYQKSLEEDRRVLNQNIEGSLSGSGQRLYRKARKIIPGGTQLLSKRPEMFLPESWPSYYSKADGVHVWDLDGRKYLDMSHNGIGTCILGASDSDVDVAVQEAIQAGSMSTLNAPEEVELAELLFELHPWAEMARYARTGGEAMAVAVRIARAYTGRDKVAFCGYHGWHDWYLASNLAENDALDGHLLPGLCPAGVPRGLLNTAFTFSYNQLEELKAIVNQHGNDLAAIIMEPMRSNKPEDDFLQHVREIADEIAAVLIFDECTAAFRQNTGGAHRLLGVDPDVAMFAKAMSNGYPMAAIIGKRNVMEAAQNSFISSTYWTERIGPAAALATIRKHRQHEVPKHLKKIGGIVQKGWADVSERTGLPIEISGIEALSHFDIDHEKGREAKTLFTQEMLKRGFLASTSFYVTYAHREEHVFMYLDAVEEVFSIIAQALDRCEVSSKLEGPVTHTGFKRLSL
jgi:glutamate-1-semialdehyde aminotransferase/spore coat polysaccharide biosynthesis protein SpsF (cytidylyltransferase family)